MKRKLLSVILSFLFVFSMAISVSASADGIEDGSTTISPRAHDVEAKRELVNTQTLVKHPIGYAKGQPSNGTVFPSYGGGFYWVDGGFGNSVTLNLNLGWGPISTSDVTFCDFNYLSDMQYLQNTLEQSGHYVLPVGAPHSFARMLREDKLKDIDIIMNFGEGFLSRNREGIVPALCEIFHLPYTGSDAFAMVLTLDKHITMLYAESLGIHTPKGFLYQPQFHTLDELETLSAQAGITYPLVVKPNREGTSMGLSLVKNKDEFLAAVGRIVRTYKQEVRCDEYIGGHELAVPILGTGAEAEVLGIVEYCEQDGGIMPFYTAEKKEHGNHRTEWRSFGRETDQAIIDMALRVHRGFQCCDLSRIDLKLYNGVPYLLEVTPIPSMNRGGTFEFCAARRGMSYADLLNAVLESALRRYPATR